MRESQVLSRGAIWRACFASIAGALIVWATTEYGSTTVGYYDPDIHFWDNVISVELAAFGVCVGWFLWVGLIKEGGMGLFPKYLLQILASVIFVGYSFVWLSMLLLLFLMGRL